LIRVNPFRPRGLFVKLFLTFLVVSFAALFSVAWVDSLLSSWRFEHDVRGLLGGIEERSHEIVAARGDMADPLACAAFAQALFWRAVAVGTAEISDFDEVLSYFLTGRLHVRVVRGAQTLCASSPAASTLAAAAIDAAAGARDRDGFVRDGADWAATTRVALDPANDVHALVGVHFWHGWSVNTGTTYDIVRTFAFVGGIGVSFAAVVTFILVRRVRRATDAADRWAAGDFGARIRERSHDEFGRLAERFNRMADAMAKMFEVEKALVVSNERNRIARDLHDTSKQRAFVLGLKLTELQYEAKDSAPLLAAVADARRIADQLQQDLVNVVSGYSLPAVAELGLREALARAVSDLLCGSGIAFTLEIGADEEASLRDAPVVAQELLMITHEAVANARRHSGCRRIHVGCHRHGRVFWTIEDDGTGFDPEHAPLGMGLANLRWRADSLPQGELVVDSGASGTCIVVSFALPA
jgi:signal transduction histidine kinase